MTLDARITALAQAIGADIKAMQTELSGKADAYQAIAATTYDAAGLLTSVTYGSGSKALYAYNGDNQLVTAQHTGTDGTTVIVTVTYTYNADGTLAAATRS